ncbi:hypothetical protein BCV70DRAFT_92529 [Testicularia cyperi]|uniref:Uncharacterized protein n=1 Tax=Testicularia cyperi TaxID=1882483 RepID=A0A317XET2_9BASI|nr:hypothetical protein BCV70DRAFT_92529 [Testicularia cyperi]
MEEEFIPWLVELASRPSLGRIGHKTGPQKCKNLICNSRTPQHTLTAQLWLSRPLADGVSTEMTPTLMRSSTGHVLQLRVSIPSPRDLLRRRSLLRDPPSTCSQYNELTEKEAEQRQRLDPTATSDKITHQFRQLPQRVSRHLRYRSGQHVRVSRLRRYGCGVAPFSSNRAPRNIGSREKAPRITTVQYSTWFLRMHSELNPRPTCPSRLNHSSVHHIGSSAEALRRTPLSTNTSTSTSKFTLVLLLLLGSDTNSTANSPHGHP